MTNQLAGVTFHPWVGCRYRNSRFGVRLLVLGESHYDKPQEACSDYTSGVVKNWVFDHQRKAFFTKISKMLLQRKQISAEQRADVWHDIAFYNFIQEFVGTSPRAQPSSDQWAKAVEPFRVVLEYLEPKATLVLGFRLGKSENLRKMLNDKTIPFEIVKHPSSSVKYDEAFPTVKQLIEKAGGSPSD